MSGVNKKKINIARDKKLLAVISIFLCLYVAASFSYFYAAAGTVRRDVVRLHVLANSNSVCDQQVKLQVRDALLQKNSDMLNGQVNTENADEYFNSNKDELLDTTLGTLLENGFEYGAKIILGQEYYSTRQYGDLTFPAGEYTSLRVVLGEGKGDNWWCVMFPPLCIPVAGDIETDENKSADVLTPSGENIISSNGKYVVKFKLLEIYEELKEKIK